MSVKVDNLSAVPPIQNVKRTVETEKPANPAKADSMVDISKSAAAREDFLRALEVVKAADAPEVRADRVAELKAKINDPNYINESVLRLTAERVIDVLYN